MNTQMLHIKITKELKDFIREKANRLGLSITAYIRMLVIQDEKKENSTQNRE